MRMLCDSDKCLSCFACFASCSKGAIKMHEDELGKLLPRIDESKCVHCGCCEKVCPQQIKISEELEKVVNLFEK